MRLNPSRGFMNFKRCLPNLNKLRMFSTLLMCIGIWVSHYRHADSGFLFFVFSFFLRYSRCVCVRVFVCACDNWCLGSSKWYTKKVLHCFFLKQKTYACTGVISHGEKTVNVFRRHPSKVTLIFFSKYHDCERLSIHPCFKFLPPSNNFAFPDILLSYILL